MKIILIARVPSSQALPGYLITAPPSVCVSAVLVSLAVWIPKPKKNSPFVTCQNQKKMGPYQGGDNAENGIEFETEWRAAQGVCRQKLKKLRGGECVSGLFG